MKYATKMTLVPMQEGYGPNDFIQADDESPQTATINGRKKGNSIRQYAQDRQTKMLTVILKLANEKAYDRNAMLTSSNGEQFSILPLLIHCFSPGRSIRGLDTFIDLLYNSGVLPSDVINESVKDLLAMRLERSKSVIPEHNNVSIENPVREVVSTVSKKRMPRQQPQGQESNSPMTAETTNAPRLTRASKRRMNDELDIQPNEPPEKISKSYDWDDHDSDLE